MDEEEIWRDVCGYEGRYQVSNLGRVKSLGNDKSRKEKILIPVKRKDNYLHVNLYRNGNCKKQCIHRLVLEAFSPVENSQELQVNHINEKRDDNRLQNLEWCTCRYNNTYNGKHKRVAEKKSIPVLQLSLDGKFVKAWKSAVYAERNGFNPSNITKCCKGRLKTHKGYKWQYLHDYISQIDPRIKKIMLFGKEYTF